MTGQVKRYTKRELEAIAYEERIVWVGFPSSFRFLYEHWIAGRKPTARPKLPNLIAYSVPGAGAPGLVSSRGPSRRAWTFPPILPKYSEGTAPPGSVDPASIIAGQPSRLAEGATE
jgi:hypothetical protein